MVLLLHKIGRQWVVEAHRAGILEDHAFENAFGPLTLAAGPFIQSGSGPGGNFSVVSCQ
jgi:hypothetical protein